MLKPALATLALRRFPRADGAALVPHVPRRRRVAGKWCHERGRIELEPFGRLDAATHRALDAEAERLAAFHA
jgi:hypothetical protein